VYNNPTAPIESKDMINLKTKKITFEKRPYDVIMCYLCPICEDPIIVYWKLNGEKPISADAVGRALRDSGFGGYRFFETKGGQGFEYDSEKDPRKRHNHEKAESSPYGPDTVTQLWMPYIKLNPIFSVNEFFDKCLNAQGGNYEPGHLFVDTQSFALELIKKMRDNTAMFKVVDDCMNHGKQLFFFNLHAWAEKTTVGYSYYQSDKDKHQKLVDALREYFGALMERVHFKHPEEFTEGTD